VLRPFTSHELLWNLLLDSLQPKKDSQSTSRAVCQDFLFFSQHRNSILFWLTAYSFQSFKLKLKQDDETPCLLADPE